MRINSRNILIPLYAFCVYTLICIYYIYICKIINIDYPFFQHFLTEYGLVWCEEEGGYVLQPIGEASSSPTSTRSCSTASSSSLSSATTPSASPRRSPRPGRPPPRVKIKKSKRYAAQSIY